MRQTLAQGGIGMGVSFTWITLSGLETGMRVASTAVGLAIGVITLWSMIQKMRSGKKK